MARTPRGDTPGAWHHVMNRGLARRTVFESDSDVRYFLSGVAHAVRSGRLEVHAYCVLTTHFHLLVRSPRGELAEAMRRIQNEYVRRFNRGRHRDGPLFRGRYRSRLVETWSYRKILVQYIDANAVSAGLVSDARLHPHGSARWYARERGPIWLVRDWVESTVRAACCEEAYRPEDYVRVFGGGLSAALQRLVERRLSHSSSEKDPLDELLGAATGEVLAWMRRKAALADGTTVGLPVAGANDVHAVVARARASEGEWLIGSSVDAWPQVEVAMLRDLCAVTFAEAGARTRMTESGAWKLFCRHRSTLREDEGYAQKIACLAKEVLGRTESGTFLSTAAIASGKAGPQAAVERNVPDSVRPLSAWRSSRRARGR